MGSVRIYGFTPRCLHAARETGVVPGVPAVQAALLCVDGPSNPCHVEPLLAVESKADRREDLLLTLANMRNEASLSDLCPPWRKSRDKWAANKQVVDR